MCHSRRVDETGVKVRGKWKYLFRAVAKDGRTLDFYLSDARNAKAARRVLAKALKRSGHDRPTKINPDKSQAYGRGDTRVER